MLLAAWWGQTFTWSDLGVIGLLVLLEGVLSIDNALVLGLLAKRLPKSQQPKALTYGLIGAFAFRVIAIGTASLLLKWRVVKLLGGGYLVYIAVKHLVFESRDATPEHVAVNTEGELRLVNEATGAELSPLEEASELEERLPAPRLSDVVEPAASGYASFWPTVAVIELTDIAFAVDSILAAIALVGSAPADHPKDLPHPKLWVVIAGGMLGVILMRIAAVFFIKLLERFPRFEVAAYLLVAVIGLKLLVDWGLNSEAHPHRVNFHDWHDPAFWIFWISMVACFCVGFLPQKDRAAGKQPA